MKRLGQVLGNALAMVLAVFALQAVAAEPQTAGRSFDHAGTGFLLLGGHATTPCETCHVGGVFKGTPRNCDGCHAPGRRVVATPKNTSHIVTDAPCDSCHFNTYTFLGAKYNHGTALPGQCLSCHNGRIAAGRPSTHNAGFMLTNSCDNCHRTYAFLPASWNHVGVTPGTCENAGCHVAGSGNRYYRSVATLPLGATHMTFTLTATKPCDTCHNFVRWTPAMHMPTTGRCDSCHVGGQAQGTPAGHATVGTEDCSGCHFQSLGSWLPALGGKPANHIPYDATATSCHTCHTTTGGPSIHGPALHAYLTGVAGGCATCHIKPGNTTYPWGQQAKSSHDGSSGSNCTGCHEHTVAAGYVRWN